MHTPKYTPYADGQWRLHIGLHALDPTEWIEIDERFAEQLALKEKLLRQRRAEVFVALEDSRPEQQETLDLLLAHLSEHFPAYYLQTDEAAAGLLTGQTWRSDLFRDAPLALAALLVQEDLCLMRPVEDRYVLSAGCVCFPSRWVLGEKLGRGLPGIHAPVPGYGERLGASVDRFFERLRVDTPMWRLNWTILDSPELFLPPGEVGGTRCIEPSSAGAQLWVRVERQTLRRLSGSGAVLFTIRTYIDSVASLACQPSVAMAMASAVRQMPSETLAYRSLLPHREALLVYLDNCGRGFYGKEKIDDDV